MSKKKYSLQCGPNLVFYDCANEPESAVTHKGCGGMFVQNLGPPNQRTCDKPDNSPGKVFCLECGHKVSRIVSASLKMGTGSDHFYFPDRNKYELCARTYIDMGCVLRYWEWSFKDGPGLSEAASRELRGARYRLAKKKRKIKPLVPKTVITQEDGDWILTHPRITMRMPMNEFGDEDVKKVFLAWGSSDNIDKSTEELETLARDALGIEFVAIVNHPDFFAVVEGDTLITMRRPEWESMLVGEFANNIKGIPQDQIENCASVFASAHNKAPDSIIVEAGFLEKFLDEDPLLEEDPDDLINPCADIAAMKVPKIKGPFGGTDMRVTDDKIIISYARGDCDLFWFLTLNREIWNNAQAQKVRKLIRASAFINHMNFHSKIAAHANMINKPTHLNSFQVSTDLETTKAILFNPLE